MAIVARRSPLHQVRGHREGRSGKTDERQPLCQRAPHPTNRLENEADLALDVDRSELRHRLHAPDGTMDDRALSLGELQPDPQWLDDEKNVGKEDRGVDSQLLHGLERDLGGELRVLAELQEAMASAEGPISRHVSPGLPHEPDRRVRSRLVSGCAEQRRIVEGHTEEGTYRRQPNASAAPASPAPDRCMILALWHTYPASKRSSRSSGRKASPAWHEDADGLVRG